jgi:TRAP-type mannitol/chloroaromatic compound transport system permease large subunit
MWFLLFLALFLIFALVRIPVAFSMCLSTIITMAAAGISFNTIGIAVFNGLNSFTFLAIPAFIIAGDIMGSTGISTSILSFTDSFIGRLRGSLGSTTVVTSLLFGTLTGSSLATTTTIAGMMIADENTDKKLFRARMQTPFFPPTVYTIYFRRFQSKVASGGNFMLVIF